MFLISYDNNTLIPLPLDGYEPDSMDFKLIINPLYRTATYSDEREIRAVVMDRDYQLLDRYRHLMPGAGYTTAQSVFSYLLPFSISLHDPNSVYLSLKLNWQGWQSLIVALLALAAFVAIKLWQRRNGLASLLDGALILSTGLYGLAVVLIMPHEE